MLKGKTTIKLFDAVSGKETGSVEKTNMVTSAVSRLLNGDPLGGLNGGCPAVEAGNMVTPVATNAMGGIMLWQDNISEDVNNIMPPSAGTNTLLGHAGGTYSGDNPLRGNYNVAESGEIEGGYRHVWDFNTDRANGNIKCVTLTSAGGGNTGFIPSEDGNGMLCSPYCFSMERAGKGMDSYTQACGRLISFTLPRYAADRAVQLVARLSDGTFFLRQSTADSLLNSIFYRAKIVDSTDIGLVDDLSLPGGCMEIIDKSRYQINGILSAYIFCDDSTYFYTVNSMSANARTYTVKKRLITTGEEVETITLVTPSEYYGYCQLYNSNGLENRGLFQIFDGCYYIFSYGYLHKFNSSGQWEWTEDLISYNPNYSRAHCAFMYQLDGYLFMNPNTNNIGSNNPGPVSGGKNGVCIAPDGTVSKVTNCTDYNDYQPFAVPDFAPQYPFILCQSSESRGNVLGKSTGFTEMKLFRPYLATINNLTVPVQKTTAQTMKIIYEIYKE